MSQQDLPLAVVSLANDSDLESLPDGTPEIYWTSGPAQQEGSGAVQMMLQAEVLARTNVTKLRFVGQWSVDGRTWYDFADAFDGLPSDSAGPLAGTCLVFPYTGTPAEYAPYQRFGIAVTGDPLASGAARLGRARLSATVTILPWAGPSWKQLVDSVTIAPSESYATAAVQIAPFRRALLVVHYEDNSATSTAQVQVSPDSIGTPTTWFTIDQVAIPTGTGELVYPATQLAGCYLRVRVVAGSGGLDAGAAVMLAP